MSEQKIVYMNETLNEREKTHGDFEITALVAQGLKDAWRTYSLIGTHDAMHREALDLICTKMARIISGNPDEKDHWKDIAGYANLISERLK